MENIGKVSELIKHHKNEKLFDWLENQIELRHGGPVSLYGRYNSNNTTVHTNYGDFEIDDLFKMTCLSDESPEVYAIEWWENFYS